MEKREMQKMFSAISKYLALQYSGTGIEQQLAVRRNDEFIVKRNNQNPSVKSTAHSKPVSLNNRHFIS